EAARIALRRFEDQAREVPGRLTRIDPADDDLDGRADHRSQALGEAVRHHGALEGAPRAAQPALDREGRDLERLPRKLTYRPAVRHGPHPSARLESCERKSRGDCFAGG